MIVQEEQEPWSMWSVYDHPKEYPVNYMARRWEIRPSGATPTEDVLVCNVLEPIRAELLERGLYRIERDDADDPVIIETWI